MLVKSGKLVGRDREWAALARFVERQQRLALVYGPRRVGKSFLIDQLAEASGGLRFQAITGLPATQLADFGRVLGGWLGAGSLHLTDWGDAISRLARLEAAFVAIDELPYLIESAPELPGLLQRYVDDGEGPPLILAGSSLSVMAGLAGARAPLYGRASVVVVPEMLAGADLAALWGVGYDPVSALWIDAALGGLPGYRPLIAPPGKDRHRWMVEEVLAPGSPLLDAAEAALSTVAELSPLRAPYRSILGAIADGEHTFSAITRVAGLASGALTRPLAALGDAGLVERIPNPLRARRDLYDLADPHLRFWLELISPNRSYLRAGRAPEIWAQLGETTWPSKVLGPRWESVVRAHAAQEGIGGLGVGAGETVGATTVSDPKNRRTHEVDLVIVREGEVICIGEAKLRQLGRSDLERLAQIRDLLKAPSAKLLLASATAVDLPADASPDLIALGPEEIYAAADR